MTTLINAYILAPSKAGVLVQIECAKNCTAIQAASWVEMKMIEWQEHSPSVVVTIRMETVVTYVN